MGDWIAYLCSCILTKPINSIVGLYKEISKLRKADQSGRKKLIQDFLNENGLESWTVGNVDNSSGQSITADCISSDKKIPSGKLKIYDLFKRENSEDRFIRELRILKDLKYSDGIIEILDSNIEEGILITEKGDPLRSWWKKFRTAHTAVELYKEAVEILKNLSEAVALCHENGVIHRDIKVPNVVVVKGQAKLIDFGIAYEENSARITLEDEIVGNRLTSPSPMQNPDAEPLAWYDFYQLNQVFLWLICETRVNEWPRPLDWRFVEFPLELLKETPIIEGIRAVSAICSDFDRCPRDGKVMHDLIGNLLVEMDKEYSVNMKIDMKSIEQARKSGRASSSLIKDENLREINSTEKLYTQIGKRLAGAIEQEISKPEYKELVAKITAELQIEGLIDDAKKLIERADQVTGCNRQNFSIMLGEMENQNHFHVVFGIVYHKSTYLNKLQTLRHEYLPFIFQLTRYCSKHTPEIETKRMHYQIFIENSGNIHLYKGVNEKTMQYEKEVTIDDMVALVVDLINDPEYWKLLYA